LTTIAYKDGVIAADSCATDEGSETAGAVKTQCEKLFRKIVDGRNVIIATAGETAPGLTFVQWYGSGKKRPSRLADADFTVLVLDDGVLYESGPWCVLEKVMAPFYAIGSGRKCALAAMACGKTALEAVEVASLFDPYTAGPFVWMT